MNRPTIDSPRLILRPFEPEDGPTVQRLAGERLIADTTLNIPHPYEDGMAEAWIATHQPAFEAGELSSFAITLRPESELIGAIGLVINRRFDNAELGYWIGLPFWNHGYCTEAVHRVIDYGFSAIGLNRIHAHYLSRNPASGRVMQKVGMIQEGTSRQHVKKWDVYEDIVRYGILRSEWPG